MVLRRGKEFCRSSVAKGVQRDLRSFEEFLDHYLFSRRAKGFAYQNFFDRLIGFSGARTHQDTFPKRQTVSFHRATPLEGAREGFRGVASEKVPERAVGI